MSEIKSIKFSIFFTSTLHNINIFKLLFQLGVYYLWFEVVVGTGSFTINCIYSRLVYVIILYSESGTLILAWSEWYKSVYNKYGAVCMIIISHISQNRNQKVYIISFEVLNFIKSKITILFSIFSQIHTSMLN